MDNQHFTSIARGINLEAAGIDVTSDIAKGVSEACDGNITYLPVSNSILKGVQTLVHTNPEDTLEKGVFADTFEYKDTYSFPIRKSGKEMKESLEKTIKYMTSELSKCEKSLASLLKKCKGAKPSNKPSGYMTRGLDSKMPMVPNMFSYDEMTEALGDKKSMTYDSPMGKYNEESRKYISICTDKIIAETMLDGIIDDREYTLSIKQAARL